MNQLTNTQAAAGATRKVGTVIEQLRAEAKKNMALNSMCHMFAARSRARSQVTMANLTYVMTKEGFKHKPEDYAQALKFLAGLGFGTLEFDKHHNVKALVNIKVTLQSIGQAAVGNQDIISKFTPANKYSEIQPTVKLVPERIPPMPTITEVAAKIPADLKATTVIIAGPDGVVKRIEVDSELANIIAQLAKK